MGKRSLRTPGLENARCPALPASSESTFEGTGVAIEEESVCFLPDPCLHFQGLVSSCEAHSTCKVLIPRQLTGSQSSPGENEAKEI